MANFESLEKLILDVKESLEREIHAIATRFDTQSARLERHAAYWQTGRRWSAHIDDWADKIDTALEQKDREIAELRQRLNRLEKGRGNGNP